MLIKEKENMDMWYKELKEIRLAIGMQAKELAEKVGKSATYIQGLKVELY